MVARPQQVYHNGLDEILGRLEGVRTAGGGYSAKCPAHDDRRNSLSVKLGDSGRVLLYCHAGCQYSDVAAALGLDRHAPLVASNGNRPTTRPQHGTITRFEIRDTTGNVVAVHPRKDFPDGKKSCWFELPDGRPGLDGLKAEALPLFGTERLADRPDEPAVIVEGEKAAQALLDVGCLALGTVTGAPGTPDDDVLAVLRDRELTLWPDNDSKGRHHMAKIGAALNRLGMPYRVVTWPSAPPKGDAADFLAQADVPALISLLDSAQAPPDEEEGDGALLEADEAVGPTQALGILLSDVQPERVSWLWPGYLPFGKVSILDGDPGLGKSTLTLDLAARLSAGLPLPDGTPTRPRGVVLLSAEDGLADTIRPRLDAAGADTTRVLALPTVTDHEGERLPQLPDDLPIIEEAVRRMDAGLVVIDPLMAFLNKDVNSFSDQHIRRALAPLAALAERAGAAVVLVRHLNKASGGHAIYRGGGSIGIVGAARSGLLVARDPDDPERRILASVKSNLGPPPPALAYHLSAANNGAVCLTWDGTSTHTAESLLAAPLDSDERTALDDAKDFLLGALANGPMPVTNIRSDARQAGIADRTLERAKLALSARAIKEGFGEAGRWRWQLPQTPEVALSPPSKAYVRQPQGMASLGKLGGLSEGRGEGSAPSTPEVRHPKSLALFDDVGVLRTTERQGGVES